MTGTTARSARRPLVLVGVAGGLAVLALVVGLAVAGADDAGDGLPDTLAGLPAQDAGPGGLAEQLHRRLAAEPSVADVAVRAYGRDGRGLVVLDLTPRSPFTDATAGALTSRLLGGGGTSGAAGAAPVTTEDGLARITCAAPTDPPARTATCVSVEAERALVVLSTGDDRDPVALTTAVRDEVLPVG